MPNRTDTAMTDKLPKNRRDLRKWQGREREKAALELRLQGMSYENIARQLDYKARQSAHSAVKRALDRIPKEPAERYIALQKERLETMLGAVFDQACAGDLKAVETTLALLIALDRYSGFDPKRYFDRDDTAEVTSMLDELLISSKELLIRGRLK